MLQPGKALKVSIYVSEGSTRHGVSTSSAILDFLFYRGVGSFATPLRVSITTDGVVSVVNTGSKELAHLFLISIHDDYGAFEPMQTLTFGSV